VTRTRRVTRRFVGLGARRPAGEGEGELTEPRGGRRTHVVDGGVRVPDVQQAGGPAVDQAAAVGERLEPARNRSAQLEGVQAPGIGKRSEYSIYTVWTIYGGA
jgi:hypothetical protein